MLQSSEEEEIPISQLINIDNFKNYDLKKAMIK